MRALFTLIFSIAFINLDAQRLYNTEWVRVLLESNVKGKTVTKQLLGSESAKYLFKEKTVLISLHDEYSTEMQYSLTDSTLTIGKFNKYKIDSISEGILVVEDLPQKAGDNENSNIYTYLNTDYLFDFLKQTNQLSIVNDSMIIASNLFSPAYRGKIDSLFFRVFSDIYTDISFTGTFAISKDGNITDVEIPINKKGVKGDVKKISDILKSTKGFWIIPPTPKPYYYKIDFLLLISHFDPLVGVNFYMHPTKK
jgi:hypothetical protein